jgi:hypothetical protein
VLRAIGILITCRNDFGFGRCMRHRHGVDKLAQNEAAQEEQRHRPALEIKSSHTCRVTTGRIPRNGCLVSYGDSRRDLWTPLNGHGNDCAYTQTRRSPTYSERIKEK